MTIIFCTLCVVISCFMCMYLKNIYFFIFAMSFVLFALISLLPNSKKSARVIRIIQVAISLSATVFFITLHLYQNQYVNDYLCLALLCVCALGLSLVINRSEFSAQS